MAKRNHKQDTIDNNTIEIVRPKVKPKPTLDRYYYRHYAGFYYIYDRNTGDKLCSAYNLESAVKIEDALNGKT